MRFAHLALVGGLCVGLFGCANMEQTTSSISCMLSRAMGGNAQCGDGNAPATTSGQAGERFAKLQQVLDSETQMARQAQAAAVEATRALPANQRATSGPVQMLQVAIEDSQQPGTARTVQTLDSITVDLPLAGKGKAPYTQAMDTLKELANTLADNRGAATISVVQSQADVQAKRVNTASGVTQTAKGNPVSVQKSTSSTLPAGVERYTIRAGAIRGKL